MEELLKNNAGCQLPCWWGITPDETSWTVAQQFFAPFATSVGQGESGNTIEAGTPYVTTNYEVKYPFVSSPFGGRILLSLRNNVVHVIEIWSAGTGHNYVLRNMLAVYGQPALVYIQTSLNIPHESGTSLPFHVVLFYPDQGILADYTYALRVVSNKIWGCPDATGPQLHLWLPAKRAINLQNLQSVALGPDPVTKLQLLEDSTDMNVEQFYDTFRQPNSSACVETPKGNWQ